MKNFIFLVVTVAALGVLIPTLAEPIPVAEASDPFVGEIKTFAGNFAPRNWAFCDGQLLSVSQNDALFSLLGTIYGGDGRTTFALPDFRGRVAIHAGTGPGLSPHPLGQKSGFEDVTLSTNNLPAHDHGENLVFSLKATTAPGTSNFPTENSIFARSAARIFSTVTDGQIFEHSSLGYDDPNAPLSNGITATSTLAQGGTGAPIDNTQPSLAINRIIALFGVYPSRN